MTQLHSNEARDVLATTTDRSDLRKTESTRSPFDFAAWLIDLDGTLYRQAFVRSTMALELALWGRSLITTLKEFRREHERMHHIALPPDSNPFELQIQRTAERLGVRADRVSSTIDEWMISRPGKWLRLFRRRRLLARIAEFRSRGGKTAVASDYPALRRLVAMGISDQFDVVVASGEPGGPHQLKPSPAGYLLAASALDVSPEQCLVIGDRADADGEAACRAQMRFQHVASRWPA